jgi:glutaredoxin
MELKEGVLYKFEGNRCPVCKIMEERLTKLGKVAEHYIVPDDEDAFSTLQSLTDQMTLPVFVYKAKDKSIQILAGLKDEKELKAFINGM